MFVRLKLIAGAEKADGVYHRHCQDYKVAEVEHTAGNAAKQRNNGHQRHDSAGNERRAYRLHSSAAEGAKSIASLKEQLGSYKTFYDGLCSYTYGADNAAAGATALNSGAVTLADGAKQLDDGAGELKSGIGELKDSVPELIDGIEQLRNGSEELYDGLCEFNERGIEKLVDAFDGDLASLGERLKAIKELSASYDTYSGKAEGMSGTVKFIYRTEAAE